MKFSIFETAMLVCFGVSWPLAILKTIRAKNPTGKSYLFTILVLVGYIAGCLHKILYNRDWVFWLYLLNGVMVAIDLILCLYYARRLRKADHDGLLRPNAFQS